MKTFDDIVIYDKSKLAITQEQKILGVRALVAELDKTNHFKQKIEILSKSGLNPETIKCNDMEDLIDGYRDFVGKTKDLDHQRILHIRDIKKICIDYRLRFYSKNHYNGFFPPDFAEHVNKFITYYHLPIGIIASHKRYYVMVANYSDQAESSAAAVFYKLSDHTYYYICGWGNVNKPSPILEPIKSPDNYFKYAVSLTIALVFLGMANPVFFQILSALIVVSSLGFVWLATKKEFSSIGWNKTMKWRLFNNI